VSQPAGKETVTTEREREDRGMGPYEGPRGTAGTSETLVNLYQSTWRYIPEDRYLPFILLTNF
jgi:hypothetical protein